jgi:hypothetical protein
MKNGSEMTLHETLKSLGFSACPSPGLGKHAIFRGADLVAFCNAQETWDLLRELGLID